MRHTFYCFLSALFMIAGMVPAASAQLEVMQGNDISFGTIYQTGAMVHKVITVKNVGSDSVKIGNVSTSCGCTAAIVATKALAPGQETDIRIQFNPAGYIGGVTKYIYITSSYKKSPLMTVRMTGNVAYALQPTPRYVQFNNEHPGKLDSTEISLSNTTSEPLRITKIELPSKEITYKLSKEILKPGEFANLDLYLDPKHSKDIDGYITIHTTSDKQPQLQIRIFAGIIGN